MVLYPTKNSFKPLMRRMAGNMYDRAVSMRSFSAKIVDFFRKKTSV
jgi:hypothetical protein